MKVRFFIFTISIIFWSFSLYFYNNPVLFDSLQWLKMTFALTIIVLLGLFSFLVSIANLSLKKFKPHFIISASLSFILILVIFFHEGFKNYLTAISPQGAIFLLLLFSYTGLGIAALFERSLKTSTLRHLQAIYILVGFGALITTLAILYLFFPFITKKEYFWLGPVFAFLFLLSCLVGYYLNQEFEKRKEAERLVREWEELARAKDQFLLSLQHHLRTPLTPIKGYLEGILEGTYGREENPVIKEKLIEMKKLVNTLYSLIESLLDIQESRIGKIILNLENLQIDNLIRSIIEELRPEAEKKGLYLKLESPPLPPIKADKKKLREAIWNLVDNAIKYTHRGGVNIRSKIKDQKLKIEIEDTGIGMKKEEIDYFLKGKLFERGEEAKKLYGPGRGIGLTIALEFIKAHGGKIWAASGEGDKGTIFWIELPIK